MVWTFDADEREKRIPKKMLHTKIQGKDEEEGPDRLNQKRYRNEKGKLGRNSREQEVGEQRQLEISLLTVNPYLQKQLKNDDDARFTSKLW